LIPTLTTKIHSHDIVITVLG